MTTTRETFLQRVRQAVRQGNRTGNPPEVRPRGRVGYQGAGPDLVFRFRDELEAAGGRAYVVSDSAAAAAQVIELVQTRAARRVLLGRGPFIDGLDLRGRLGALGVEAGLLDSIPPADRREWLFAADLGVTGVQHLVAETGSLVFLAGPEEARSLSLLPPVQVVVAHRDQLLPDLFDLFGPEVLSKDRLPSCLTLVTGPSKTGDIELRLVTGVHGPGEVHVVLIAPEPPAGSASRSDSTGREPFHR